MDGIAISPDKLNELIEYPNSMPPKVPGRRWKRRDGNKWLVGEYLDTGDPDHVGVRWSQVQGVRVTQEFPDFMEPVEGIDEDYVQRLAMEWSKGGYIDADSIEGETTRGKLEHHGWLLEARRVLWTLKQVGQ